MLPSIKPYRAVIGALAISGMLLSGCATYRPVDEAFHAVLEQPYLLGPGDTVRITVFEQNDLTNSYSVSKAGMISFPLVGDVSADGRTVDQLQAEIRRKLQGGFLRDPDVSVEVATYRPFFIMGEVNSGGQYTYVPGMTIQNAIAIAGGFSPRAFQADADITRQVNGKILNGRVPLSDPIMPGDTIYIRERLF